MTEKNKNSTLNEVENKESTTAGEISGASSAVDEKPEEIVEVKASVLQSIREDMAKLKADNAMLTEVADKKSMAAYQARHKGKLPTEMSIRTIMHDEKEKVVLGWSDMVMNNVYKDTLSQKWKEDQTVKLMLEDKTVFELPYMIWQREHKKVLCKVVSRRTNEETGAVFIKLKRMDNNKEYEVSSVFVN